MNDKTLKIIFSGNQPIVGSILYVLILPVMLAALCYSTFEFISEKSFEEFYWALLAIPFILNVFFINKFIRYGDRSSTKRPLTASESILSFLIYFSSVIFLQNEMFSSEAEELAILLLIIGFIVCLYGVAINYRIQMVTFSRVGVNEELTGKDFELVAEKAIKSDAFLSAIQTTLPVTKEGESDIAKHFPFILGVINKRRKNYQKSSQIFFISLITFAIISTSLITFYGFVLIDSVPIGASKSIKDVEEHLSKLSSGRIDYAEVNRKFSRLESNLAQYILNSYESLESIGEEHYDVSNYYKKYKDRAEYFDRGPSSRFFIFENQYENDSLLLRVSEYKNVSERFQANLPKYKQKTHKNLKRDLNIFDDIDKEIKKVMSEYKDIKSVLSRSIEAAKKENGTDESRMYSLLKRLSVGIIIGSFFIAILRYLAQQYQANMSRLHEAEMDEIEVRKFYIAYDVAGDVTRPDLLDSFIKNKVSEDSTSRVIPHKSLDEGDKKIITEILSILKKKI